MGGKDRILAFAKRLQKPALSYRKMQPALVLASEATVMAEGTYPRATKLGDGSILGVHTAFDNGVNIIVITRGTNDGQKWSRFGEVGWYIRLVADCN